MPLDIFYEITGEIFSNGSEKNLLQSSVIFCFKYFCLVGLTAGIELESFSRQFDWNIFALVLTFRIFLPSPLHTPMTIIFWITIQYRGQYITKSISKNESECSHHSLVYCACSVLRMPLNNYLISRLCLIMQLQHFFQCIEIRVRVSERGLILHHQK